MVRAGHSYEVSVPRSSPSSSHSSSSSLHEIKSALENHTLTTLNLRNVKIYEEAKPTLVEDYDGMHNRRGGLAVLPDGNVIRRYRYADHGLMLTIYDPERDRNLESGIDVKKFRIRSSFYSVLEDEVKHGVQLNRIEFMAAFPDSTVVVVVSGTNTFSKSPNKFSCLEHWDIKSQTVLDSWHYLKAPYRFGRPYPNCAEVTTLLVHPFSGQLVTGHNSGAIRYWDKAKKVSTIIGGDSEVPTRTKVILNLPTWSKDVIRPLINDLFDKLIDDEPPYEYKNRVTALAGLPDGTLVSGSANAIIKHWSRSGQCLATLNEHTSGITALSVFSNGTIVSGSYDGTLSHWDLKKESGSSLWRKSYTCLATLPNKFSSVDALTVLPDDTLEVVSHCPGSIENSRLKRWKGFLRRRRPLFSTEALSLLEFLRANRSVTEANLYGVVVIDDKAVPILSSIIETHPTLKILDLRQTGITPEGVHTLYQANQTRSRKLLLYHESLAELEVLAESKRKEEAKTRDPASSARFVAPDASTQTPAVSKEIATTSSLSLSSPVQGEEGIVAISPDIVTPSDTWALIERVRTNDPSLTSLNLVLNKINKEGVRAEEKAKDATPSRRSAFTASAKTLAAPTDEKKEKKDISERQSAEKTTIFKPALTPIISSAKKLTEDTPAASPAKVASPTSTTVILPPIHPSDISPDKTSITAQPSALIISHAKAITSKMTGDASESKSGSTLFPSGIVQIDTPDDHNCLFWSAVLGLLLPCLENEMAFNHMYVRLFGSGPLPLGGAENRENTLRFIEAPEIKEQVRTILQAYDCQRDTPLKSVGDILKTLVCRVFRGCVVNALNVVFPDTAAKEPILITAQLDNPRIKTWEAYTNAMREPTVWGGDPEIRAISHLAQMNICVASEDAAGITYPFPGSTQTLYLAHVNAKNEKNGRKNHYHYGLSHTVYKKLTQTPPRLIAPLLHASATTTTTFHFKVADEKEVKPAMDVDANKIIMEKKSDDLVSAKASTLFAYLHALPDVMERLAIIESKAEQFDIDPKVLRSLCAQADTLIDLVQQEEVEDTLHQIIFNHEEGFTYYSMFSVLICGTQRACESVFSGYSEAGKNYISDKVAMAFDTIGGMQNKDPTGYAAPVAMIAKGLAGIIKAKNFKDRSHDIMRLAFFFVGAKQPEKFLRQFARILTFARLQKARRLAKAAPLPTGLLDRLKRNVIALKDWVTADGSSHPIKAQARKDWERLIAAILDGSLKTPPQQEAMLEVLLRNNTKTMRTLTEIRTLTASSGSSVSLPLLLSDEEKRSPHSTSIKTTPALVANASTAAGSDNLTTTVTTRRLSDPTAKLLAEFSLFKEEQAKRTALMEREIKEQQDKAKAAEEKAARLEAELKRQREEQEQRLEHLHKRITDLTPDDVSVAGQGAGSVQAQLSRNASPMGSVGHTYAVAADIARLGQGLARVATHVETNREAIDSLQRQVDKQAPKKEERAWCSIM